LAIAEGRARLESPIEFEARIKAKSNQDLFESQTF